MHSTGLGQSSETKLLPFLIDSLLNMQATNQIKHISKEQKALLFMENYCPIFTTRVIKQYSS